MASLRPEEARLNRGKERSDVISNYNVQLALMEGQDNLRLSMMELTGEMNELIQDSQVRKLLKPDEVSDQPIRDAAKGSARLVPGTAKFLLFCAVCYGITKLLFLAGQIPLIGFLIYFLGMVVGLLAYWPLWPTAKLFAIFTPYTVKPLMETLTDPVMTYVVYFAVSGITILLVTFLVQAIRGMTAKKEYQKDLKYYNQHKDTHAEEERQRIHQVMKEIEALRPRYEQVRGDFIAYEDGIQGMFQFLRVFDRKYQHKEAVMTMRDYIRDMRADTPTEAAALYREECTHREELRRIQALYENQAASDRLRVMLQEMDAASARLDAENARAVMERTAKRAHNASVYEDYKYHEMVGDVNMDLYAQLKVLDLEL